MTAYFTMSVSVVQSNFMNDAKPDKPADELFCSRPAAFQHSASKSPKETARAEARAGNFQIKTALSAVLVALLTSFYRLFMAAAAGPVGLRVAAT
nr:hypothetical protein [Rhizobium phaseoli]